MNLMTPKSGNDDSASAYSVTLPVSPEEVKRFENIDATEIFYIASVNNSYLEALEDLLSSLIHSEPLQPKSSQFIPFLITSAAALECLLNDALIQYAWYITGLNATNSFATSLMSMSLRSKLNSIVTLISRNRFAIRHDSPMYQQLIRLIKTRNQLMHGKPLVGSQQVKIEHAPDGYGWCMNVPKAPHHGITLKDCTGFLRELQSLSRLLHLFVQFHLDTEIPEGFHAVLRTLPPR
jgi:hypothetical protein